NSLELGKVSEGETFSASEEQTQSRQDGAIVLSEPQISMIGEQVPENSVSSKRRIAQTSEAHGTRTNTIPPVAHGFPPKLDLSEISTEQTIPAPKPTHGEFVKHRVINPATNAKTTATLDADIQLSETTKG